MTLELAKMLCVFATRLIWPLWVDFEMSECSYSPSSHSFGRNTSLETDTAETVYSETQLYSDIFCQCLATENFPCCNVVNSWRIHVTFSCAFFWELRLCIRERERKRHSEQKQLAIGSVWGWSLVRFTSRDENKPYHNGSFCLVQPPPLRQPGECFILLAVPAFWAFANMAFDFDL